MEPVITVENLSKQYRIGTLRSSHQTFREALINAVRKPVQRARGLSHSEDATIWALKDVNFEIHAGEVVGIIGENGAGKSTLLKILSRVTEPTLGQATLRGRIGSLLEVGTGFHPELTGRENVFLNGAILGMTRTEISRNFDEIIAFSEIEKFIDTPVKWYSSGMYLRLAFSVAAHLNPEILIIDEVLAVGDAVFQRKCFNKMKEIREDGRTILFVSHNMQAVTRLCKRLIYLSHGGLADDGPAYEVASRYLGSRLQTTCEKRWETLEQAPGNEIARLWSVRIHNEKGETIDTIDIRRPVGIEIAFEVLEPGHMLVPNYHFFTEDGNYVFIASDHDPDWRRRPRPAGRYTSTAWIPGNFLAEGVLKVGVALSTMSPVFVHFFEENVVAFLVVDSSEGDSARGDYTGHMPGLVRPLLSWTTQFEPLGTVAAKVLVGESA
jgi:lipopolysaccharide transport system ATP-binding protein